MSCTPERTSDARAFVFDVAQVDVSNDVGDAPDVRIVDVENNAPDVSVDVETLPDVSSADVESQRDRWERICRPNPCTKGGFCVVIEDEAMCCPNGEGCTGFVDYHGQCALHESGEVACWDAYWDFNDTYVESPIPQGDYRAVKNPCVITNDNKYVCFDGGQHMPLGDIEVQDFGMDVSRHCVIAFDGFHVCESERWSIRDETFESAFGRCLLTNDGDVRCFREQNAQRWELHPGPYIAHSNDCALTPEGSVECWNGALGSFFDDETGFSYINRECAGKPNGEVHCERTEHELADIVNYAEGANVANGACALDAAGKVVCRGFYLRGQCEAPVGSFVDVKSGYFHTCGLRASGELACWGSNEFGQIDVPVGNYRWFDTGVNTTCAITVDDEVRCWGFGVVDDPRILGAQTDIDRIYASGPPCAIRNDSTAFCLGDELNKGPVDFELEGANYVQLAQVESIVCALKAGGELGCNRYQPDSPIFDYATPTGSYSRLVTDGIRVCALRTEGGAVCFLGGNEPSEHTSERLMPFTVFPTPERIKSGLCILDDEGLLNCSLDGIPLELTSAFSPPNHNYSKVVGSLNSLCGLRVDGEIDCWGFN